MKRPSDTYGLETIDKKEGDQTHLNVFNIKRISALMDPLYLWYVSTQFIVLESDMQVIRKTKYD